MKVVYVTYPWFLDFSIEYIRELSKHVELHVLVVCPENRTSGTIFHLERKMSYKKGKFYKLEEVSEELRDARYFDEYVQSCSSFLLSFSPQKWLSFKNVQYNYDIYKHINKINPDIVHFDDLTIELSLLSFLLIKMKLVIDVHDPVAHSGEKNMRRDIVRRCYYPLANKFITYSNFSSKIFFDNYKKDSAALSLTPYTFYKKYSTSIELDKNRYILFFGRISAYKGIEKLINAFVELRREFPNIHLVIAGKSVYGYSIPFELINNEGVIVYDRFIPNNEMATLFEQCEFVVCPYEDASQSGVVMTSLAFEKKVVVSKVGGLFEAINDSNGIIYDNSMPGNLVEAMRTMLSETKDFSREKPFVIDKKSSIEYNVTELINIYRSIKDV